MNIKNYLLAMVLLKTSCSENETKESIKDSIAQERTDTIVVAEIEPEHIYRLEVVPDSPMLTAEEWINQSSWTYAEKDALKTAIELEQNSIEITPAVCE